MIRVGLDFGHGGSDPGAVCDNFIEKDINLKIGLYIVELCKLCGVEPVTTRTTDKTVTLAERSRYLNSKKLDCVISTHNNAGKGDGYDVFYSKVLGVSKVLGENLAKEFEALGQNKHYVGTKIGSSGRDYYYMIRKTIAPAVLGEFAFLDNKKDRQLLDSEEELKNVARAYVKAICKTFNVRFVDFPENNRNEVSTKLYKVQVGAFSIKSNAEKLLKDLKSKGYSAFIKEE